MPATEEYTKEEYDDSTSTIKFQPQLEEALKKLERLITRLNQPDLPQQDLPDDYTDSPYVENFRLKYTTSDEYVERTVFPDKNTITLEQLRRDMPQVMQAYIQDTDADSSVLLLKIGAGCGKTHAGVQVAQWAAQEGLRVLWAANRHNMFSDLQQIPGFDLSLWKHWFPIHENKGADDPCPTTCRYAKEQKLWSIRGYKTIELCKQLCVLDNWIQMCPYREQAKCKEPIIFAMHQHLANGIAISDFDVVFIDELPIQAFWSEKVIPKSGIDVQARGSLKALTDKLSEITLYCSYQKKPVFFEGKRLLDIIGPILVDLYSEIQLSPNMLPQVPIIFGADEVESAPYFYLIAFLEAAVSEYNAWRSGWSYWANRVKVSAQGVHILSRTQPWEKLPSKIIALDATAHGHVYQQIFQRSMVEYNPKVQRKGKIHQITGLLHGTETAKNPVTAQKLGTIVDYISDGYDKKKVGVVCHKGMKDLFIEKFGESNVVHFFGSRGTNILKDVECLIVAGTPSPDIRTVISTATALDPDRVEPFGLLTDSGTLQVPFTYQVREYLISDECSEKHFKSGGVKRMFRGFWPEPILQSIYSQCREAELVQAIHRARPNVKPCDIWLLSPIALDEMVDYISDDPDIGPKNINWRIWIKLKPWLDEQWDLGKEVSIEDIAVFLDRSPKYIANQQWLHAIALHLPDKWIRMAHKTTPGRGKAKFVLVPGEE